MPESLTDCCAYYLTRQTLVKADEMDYSICRIYLRRRSLIYEVCSAASRESGHGATWRYATLRQCPVPLIPIPTNPWLNLVKPWRNLD